MRDIIHEEFIRLKFLSFGLNSRANCRETNQRRTVSRVGRQAVIARSFAERAAHRHRKHEREIQILYQLERVASSVRQRCLHDAIPL